MEERIGTSLDLITAGDPEAIAIMEANMLKETLEWRRKLKLDETAEKLLGHVPAYLAGFLLAQLFAFPTFRGLPTARVLVYSWE